MYLNKELDGIKVSFSLVSSIAVVVGFEPEFIESAELSDGLRLEYENLKRDRLHIFSMKSKSALNGIEEQTDDCINTLEFELNKKRKDFTRRVRTEQPSVGLLDFTFEIVRFLEHKRSLSELSGSNWVNELLIGTVRENPEILDENGDLRSQFLNYVLEFYDFYGLEVISQFDDSLSELVNSYRGASDIEKVSPAESKLDGKLWFSIEALSLRWKEHKFGIEEIEQAIETGELQVCIKAKVLNLKKYKFLFSSQFAGAVSKLTSVNKLNPEIEGNGALTKVNHYCEIDASKSLFSGLLAVSPDSAGDILAKGFSDSPVCGINWYQLELCPLKTFNLRVERSHLVVTSSEVRRFELETIQQPADSSTGGNDLTNGVWRTMHVLVKMLLESGNYKSQAKIIEAINENYPNTHGTSKRKLEEFFSEAKRRFDDS
ncbi:hypothetical protein LJ739_06680 [Aestuariibacter halophilus]|uniref:Uncharacterized protein n=1 Tax=Fluctibacter halophilus TaxID=226011 RepID=A0ABS8G774_9ALTE|nr:hypothetical protein [Aestuariibacter halophilus]MCC2615921.1 hypothetical protein [Aestuariibacter halophilus]